MKEIQPAQAVVAGIALIVVRAIGVAMYHPGNGSIAAMALNLLGVVGDLFILAGVVWWIVSKFSKHEQA